MDINDVRNEIAKTKIAILEIDRRIEIKKQMRKAVNLGSVKK
ncbi:MAG TPA: hypothetical protein VMY59_01010 [Candidatus Thermoplasmatota archaeon]|nr:hypothetical protein [Candidatus Thermoplasmatota archaeon]